MMQGMAPERADTLVWRLRFIKPSENETRAGGNLPALAVINGVPTGSRTPAAGVKSRCPRPLDDGDVLSV